jgi:hypothetical protein
VSGPGKSCCGDNDCSGTGASSCTQNVCSVCPVVQENQATHTYDFVVDPNGAGDGAPSSEIGASGADQPGCRFRTLTYALSFAGRYPGVGPATPARLLLRSDASASETYPLIVPANVSILGSSPGANPALKIPAGADGVHLTGSVSGLSKLLIDGVNGNVQSALRYNRAIVVQGTGQSGVFIDHVTVQNSRLDAIQVGGANGLGGTLTINSGTIIQGSGYIGMNGAPTVRSNGVLVTGTGALTVAGGADQIAFSSNSQHGIAVAQSGSVALTASIDVSNPTASTYDTAPVVAIGNDVAGLSIAQTPTGASTNSTGWQALPTNSVTGLVSLRTAAGNGVRIEGGSKATIRSCVSYGNAASGLIVAKSGAVGALAADADFIGAIDLGTSGSAGSNVLQVPGQPLGAVPANGELPNGGAGICLNIDRVVMNGQTLGALGNILVRSTTNQEVACATAPANTPVIRRDNCRSVPSTMTSLGIPTSIGVEPTAGGGVGPNANAIDVTQCSGQ